MLSVRSAIFRRVLAGAVVLGSVWLFHSHSIAPLWLREKDAVRKLGELREHLDSARKTLREIKDSEQETGQARAALNGLLGDRAENSVMVSVPESIKQHFSRFGLPSVVIRLNTIQEEPDLPGYQRVYWSVGLPIPRAARNVEGLLLAVAELEEQDRFIKVIDFALQPDVEDPSLRTAAINIMALVRK